MMQFRMPHNDERWQAVEQIKRIGQGSSCGYGPRPVHPDGKDSQRQADNRRSPRPENHRSLGQVVTADEAAHQGYSH